MDEDEGLRGKIEDSKFRSQKTGGKNYELEIINYVLGSTANWNAKKEP